ncbi:hypothetical protein MXB_1516 [Myxobolus squamalis]|nr:hypothetical protein MXB_1516 [Myxobolus squamalis]
MIKIGPIPESKRSHHPYSATAGQIQKEYLQKRITLLKGEKFLNAHPNIYAFIAVIIDEEHYFTELINGIWTGRILFPMLFSNLRMWLYCLYIERVFDPSGNLS